MFSDVRASLDNLESAVESMLDLYDISGSENISDDDIDAASSALTEFNMVTALLSENLSGFLDAFSDGESVDIDIE